MQAYIIEAVSPRNPPLLFFVYVSLAKRFLASLEFKAFKTVEDCIKQTTFTIGSYAIRTSKDFNIVSSHFDRSSETMSVKVLFVVTWVD